MIKRDLLKDQCEQYGKVLAQLVRRFMGLKTENEVIQGIEYARNELQEELNLDLSTMLQLGKEHWLLFFNTQQWEPEQMEQLAELLQTIGRNTAHLELAQSYYKKALSIYELVDEKTREYSLTRAKQIDHLNQICNGTTL